MANSLKKVPLHKYHEENSYLTEFAGFYMPLWYEGIIAEHIAVRESVGIFDVTHMGRSIVEGKEAEAFLNYVITRDISNMELIQGKYSVMLNERGGIIDDLTVFRIGVNKFLVVYNASNRVKDFSWLRKNSKDYKVTVEDISDSTPMFAVQGPKAISTLEKVFNIDLVSTKRYWGVWSRFRGHEVLLTRTGYTGEDGYEVYLFNVSLDHWEEALKLWNKILEAGEEYNIKPCGLGARDTLRLEAGMCLYGHDINENINPFEAKLDFTVSLYKDDFIGKKSLVQVKEKGLEKIRVGIKLLERGVPREGYKIYSLDGKEIGIVTSGTFSALLKIGIAMGYVKTKYSDLENIVYIEVRGKQLKGKICEIPFYDTSRYGWRRKR